ncbi:MAG TPA: hypothetical protein VIL54_16470 [Natronosporangium sp.]
MPARSAPTTLVRRPLPPSPTRGILESRLSKVVEAVLAEASHVLSGDDTALEAVRRAAR